MLNHLSKHCLSVLAVFILSFGMVSASEYKVELLDENNGFASSIIFSIVQDQNGFLWFGTGYSGVMRYDGKNIVKYQHDPSDSHSLAHNNAGNLSLDKDNNIWIGSWGGGVLKYDQKTGIFTQHQHDRAQTTSISSKKIQNVFEDHQGNIWLGTGDSGLNKFNPEQQDFTRYAYSIHPSSFFSEGTSNGRIWDMEQTSAETIWIGTNKGLNSFNTSSNRFKSFIPDPSLGITGRNKIRHIVSGDDNTLFLGTDDGVLSFDLRSQTFTALEIEGYQRIGPIYSIIKTSFNQYWISSNRGVFSFSEDNLTLKKVNLGINDQCSQTLFQDRQEIIWLTCEGVGVYKIIQKNTFKLFTNPIVKFAYSLLATNDDNVLIGTAEHGIHKWNPSTNQLIALDDNPDQVIQPEIRKMAQTAKGAIWFINNQSVYKLNQQGKKQQVFAPSTMANPELFDGFKEIITDSQDTIWLGTNNGVFAIRDLDSDFEHILLGNQTFPSSLSNRVSSLYHVASNQIWIGTANGLNLWNSQTKELKTFSISNQENISTLEDNFVYVTYQDSSQRFWVSTKTGLYLLDEKTGEFSVYSEYFSEFQNLGIRFIKEDALGNLWLVTPVGVSKLNPDNGHIQHFDKSDGLSGSRYFIDLVAQTSNGTIFFSSRDGIHYFDPGSIPERQLNAKIFLTNFEVLGSPKNDHVSTIGSTNIDLAHDENYLKFEFATLDFLHSRQVKYSYKLEGFDTDWIKNGTNSAAVYTNIKGGDYTFRVRAEYKKDLWYDDELAVNVHIATPVWLQWWMFVLYACLVLLGVYYYLQRQKKSVLKLERQVAEKTASIAQKSNKLEAANKVKSQFLANMSHEIRTPLTTVIGQAEAIICRDIDGADIYREVEVIHDNGLHLLALLNNILDLTKIEENKFELELLPLDLHDFVENIYSMFSIQAQSKGLSFHTTKQLPTPLVVNIDGLRVKQILINLCSNAIKFTHKGHISFDIVIRNNELIFTITDTGIGMHTEQIQQIFESFTQGDASISRRFGGSGLGLSLSNGLAKLMDGIITVASEFGQGSVFTFSMPLTSLPEINSPKLMQSEYDFSTPESLFSGTILLAEDHVDNCRLIARLLKKLGLTVITASDGLEAINLYLKYYPDVVLLDIQMPNVDGIQAYKSLRELGCVQPIIALTANAMSHEIEQYKNLGFDGHLNKPLNRQDLIATIAKYFTSESPDAQEEAGKTLANVDMSDLVIEFKASLVDEHEQFSVHAENQDLEKLAAQAHRLIGASQLFGFAKLAEIATRLENSIKNNDLELLDDIIKNLLDELAILMHVKASDPA